VRRDEDRQVGALGGPEQVFEVLHYVVLCHGLPHDSPGYALLVQEVVLRVDDDQRYPSGLEPHVACRQARLFRLGIGEARRG
jgi:hypothetical protein